MQFLPTPERAAAGVNITSVRERVAAVAEIVKVVPQSIPATADAPAGLAFALVLLSAAADDVIAEAAATTPEALTPVRLDAPPSVAAAEDGTRSGSETS